MEEIRKEFNNLLANIANELGIYFEDDSIEDEYGKFNVLFGRNVSPANPKRLKDIGEGIKNDDLEGVEYLTDSLKDICMVKFYMNDCVSTANAEEYFELWPLIFEMLTHPSCDNFFTENFGFLLDRAGIYIWEYHVEAVFFDFDYWDGNLADIELKVRANSWWGAKERAKQYFREDRPLLRERAGCKAPANAEIDVVERLDGAHQPGGEVPAVEVTKVIP